MVTLSFMPITMVVWPSTERWSAVLASLEFLQVIVIKSGTTTGFILVVIEHIGVKMVPCT